MVHSSLLLSLALAAAPPAEPDEALDPGLTESVLVQLVEVDLLVLDASERPLTDLKAEELRVVEERRPREVVFLEPVAAQLGEAGPLAGRALVRFHLGRGMPGSPTEIEGPDPGRWILLVFDNLNGAIPPRVRAVHAALRFLDGGLQPSDRVALISLDRTLHYLEGFTRDHARLRAELEEPGTWLTAVPRDPRDEVLQFLRDLTACDQSFMEGTLPGEFLQPTNPGPCFETKAHRFAQRRRQEAVTTLDQLTYLVQALGAIPDRKWLFFFSEGFSLEPGTETVRIMSTVAGTQDAPSQAASLFGDVSANMDRFIDEASRSRTSLFVVSTAPTARPGMLDAANEQMSLTLRREVGGEPVDPFSALAQGRKEGLRAVARSAGGRSYEGDDLLASLERARDSAAGMYTLGYRADRPPGERGRRRLRVEVSRPGARAIVRPSVRLGTPPAVEVGGRIGLSPVRPLPDDRFHVPLTLELYRSSLRFLDQGGLADAKIALFAELLDMEGRRLDADFAWLGVTYLGEKGQDSSDPAFHGFVEAPDGTYWLRVRVTQPDGRSLGEVERIFTVGGQEVEAAATPEAPASSSLR
jgi:VWFA-related protein